MPAFPPLGSYLYATATAELGLVFGSFPTLGGFGTGFHYAERGGLFAQYLLAGIGGGASATAAQRRANETGRSQSYDKYSPDDFGKVGLVIDGMSTQLGGDTTGTQAELFSIRKFREHTRLPVLLDIGLAFYYFKGPPPAGVDSMGNPFPETEVLGLGLVVGLLLPVTRWAQLELRTRPVLPNYDGNPWLTIEAAGVANVGNRFYVRVGINRSLAEFTDGERMTERPPAQSPTAWTFGVGGRL